MQRPLGWTVFAADVRRAFYSTRHAVFLCQLARVPKNTQVSCHLTEPQACWGSARRSLQSSCHEGYCTTVGSECTRVYIATSDSEFTPMRHTACSVKNLEPLRHVQLELAGVRAPFMSVLSNGPTSKFIGPVSIRTDVICMYSSISRLPTDRAVRGHQQRWRLCHKGALMDSETETKCALQWVQLKRCNKMATLSSEAGSYVLWALMCRSVRF